MKDLLYLYHSVELCSKTGVCLPVVYVNERHTVFISSVDLCSKTGVCLPVVHVNERPSVFISHCGIM